MGEQSLISPGGELIPKARARKRCAWCGVVLWKPHTYRDFPRYDDKGRRLGRVPLFRFGRDGKPLCWNSKACDDRRHERKTADPDPTDQKESE